MDIILDNIFLIILLLVGAISQWLKARADAKQGQEPGYDPAELEEMFGEVERRQSRPAVPPPLPPAFPVPQGSTAAPVPNLRRASREAPFAAAAFDTSSELARQEQIAEQLKELKRTRGARETSDALIPRNRGRGAASVGSSLKSRLGNRNELRQAFVLKEILEKPIAMR
jgi:hypothetical protein